MAGYEKWSHEQLIARIQELEKQVGGNAQNTPTNAAESYPTTITEKSIPPPADAAKSLPTLKPTKHTKPRAPPKPFDGSKYSTRLIALKFAYLGQTYNGFEHHKNNSTPLPTIEEELWKALVKTRLINPIPTTGDAKAYDRVDRKTFAAWDREGADVNWDGCEYSKCGRTDRGVSAFGQVIGVRVRSNRPMPKPSPPTQDGEDAKEEAQEAEDETSLPDSDNKPEPKPFKDVSDEMPYIQLLNRVLPSSIRIYAWCPNPPADFSARFSCKERRYKYFFTNTCFAPVPGPSGTYTTPHDEQAPMREGWLDIEAMRQGCKSLIGLHDFRNFCKIDPSKQVTNFKRRIFHADIEQVSPTLGLPSFLQHAALSTTPASVGSSGVVDTPKLYSFTLHGSAFLWHQVRSLIAILFLIGQKLESPSLIPSLLDIEANPQRPKYEMASDAPLVLWDCIFPHAEEIEDPDLRKEGYLDRLQWVYVGDDGGVEPKSMKTGKGGETRVGRGKWGRGGVIDDVWEVWRGNKIDETLSALLMDKIAGLGMSSLDAVVGDCAVGGMKGAPRIFDGGNVGKAKGPYTPLLQRERQESVDVVNERYRRRKGRLEPDDEHAKTEDGDE